jgi:hypothetical protein
LLTLRVGDDKEDEEEEPEADWFDIPDEICDADMGILLAE